MRIMSSKSKNSESFYITKSFIDRNGKSTSKIIRKLGTLSELSQMLNTDRDGVMKWCKEQARIETEKEKEKNSNVICSLSPTMRIPLDRQRSFNCGYLFLQSLYYDLRLDNVCRNISSRHDFEFSLDAILSDLIYARILEPSSKQASYQYCQSLLEPPKYKQHHIYRALSILAEENDYIQAEVYKNSNFLLNRNNRILYYDCTNYFFAIEDEDDFRKYGKGKDHQPSPIVQMGLFMDGDGIPMAFDLFPGNQNEQPSMKPLEQNIIRNFGFEKFVVCTDGGLGSEDNRLFNDIEGRAFIVTQSLKKLKNDEREAAMSDDGWRRVSDDKPVDIREIKTSPESFMNSLYYKEEPYGTKKVPGQIMYVTYSPSYAVYQKNIRDKQIRRAEELIKAGKKGNGRHNPNDPGRFVRNTPVTKDGEAADKTYYSLDIEQIEKEAMYDGYYAVCTNLIEDNVRDILTVSERRWEIEESFRILKSDFQSRPVHLSREDRIKAHFLICYLSLLIYRLLEHKLGQEYTCREIITTLRKMNLCEIDGTGYIPAYTRTGLTDKLHDLFGFNTDTQVIKKSKMRSIIRIAKER